MQVFFIPFLHNHGKANVNIFLDEKKAVLCTVLAVASALEE